MDIRIFTWELSEPLRSRPFAGVLIAGVTGAVFGGLASTLPGAPNRVVLSYVAGFAVGGLIVGAALPLFRSRVIAGLVSWLATSMGLGVLWSLQRGGLSIAVVQEASFMGFAYAFAYAALFWGYRRTGSRKQSG